MGDHTKGPWVAGENPYDGHNYLTMVTTENRLGMSGTEICTATHNWNEVVAGEVRISWAEAEANARLIAAAPEMLEALLQYRNDLRYPPKGDSLERRLERVERVIAKAVEGA